MDVNIESIRKAIAENPDLLKSLEEVVGEHNRSANLEQELEVLKTQFSEETEELAKALTVAEDRADEAEANLSKAFGAMQEVLERQDVLAKCLMEGIGPAMVAMRDKLDSTQALVKAMSEQPTPSKAKVIEAPGESGGSAADGAGDDELSDDFDYQDVLRKALKVDKANGDKNYSLWKSFKALEGLPKQFRAKAVKEELV